MGGVGVSESASLLCDGVRDGFNTIANGNDGCAPASVEDFAIVSGENETAFAAHSFGIIFTEVAREERVAVFFALGFP